MILYNDMEPTEKLKIYDTGYNMNTDDDKKRIMIDYRTGDVFIPKIEITEALQSVANDFINCILNKTQPVSNYEIGLSVIKILEASSLSINQQGKEIKI
jgi:hypothetical protein